MANVPYRDYPSQHYVDSRVWHSTLSQHTFLLSDELPHSIVHLKREDEGKEVSYILFSS